jgi:SPP1 family predicted phage head-tail adaptor
MAGDLRHRVAIDKRKLKVGTRGQSTEEWEEQGRMWAKINPLWGTELELARKRQENVTTRIITRKQKARLLDSNYRLRYRSDVYQVAFVLDGADELDDIHLMCIKTSN